MTTPKESTMEIKTLRTALMLLFLVFGAREAISCQGTPSSEDIPALVRQLYPVENNQCPDDQLISKTFHKLHLLADKSAPNRKTVIDSLIGVLNDPNAKEVCISLPWLNAAFLLGELKATESLEILVENIDFRGNFPIALNNNRPVVDAIASMGDLAIPYLKKTLLDPNFIIRQDAVIALGLIGSERAKRTLEKFLLTEKNDEVVSSIKESLEQINRQNIETQIKK